MATSAGFVSTVLSTVCLQALRPTLPPVPPLTAPQQQNEAYRTACDTTDDYLRLTDGQLVEWMRPRVTRNLQNRTIRVGVKKLPPPVPPRYEPDSWSIRVVQVLASVFNFTPEYVGAPVPTGGVPQSGGRWSGLTGQLLEDEVEMTGSFLVSSMERLNLVSFGETIGYSQIGLLIEKPKAETRDDSLLAPFSSHVWLLILISMIVMGPLIWGIIRFRVWLSTGDAHLNRVIPLGSCVWFVYGALMKQGSVLSPVTDSSRMLFATWWIFITVLTAFYTANLTAYMTLSALKVPVQSIDDISGNQKSWLAPAGDSIQMYVNNSATLRRLQSAGRGSYIRHDEPIARTISKVRSGYVYIDEVSKLNAMMMADYYASNHTCHVYVVPLKDQYIKYSLAAPKDSQLHHIFDPFVHWLVMSGIASKWKRDAEVDAEPCAIPKGIQGTQLKNEELRMIYYILLVSYGCGVALLLLEVGLGRLLDRCAGGGGARPARQSLSVLQRVLGQEAGAAAGKTAWPAASGDQSKPTTTYAYGMSVNPAAVSTWSAVTTSLTTPPAGPASSAAPAGSGSGAPRSDREVLQEMRNNIKYINNRPYMFVRDGAGGVRPVPVTEERSEVFERVFKDLKERPNSSRVDDHFGDLYSPEHLMRQ
ncbi:glutamate receptor ionotropic, delta-2-like isoform X1 [Amphibalanus amphitrite]|nr:glutamate receptor ionotropic, delta-2-like isoform X1 [Amphibalanus amphitrite]